jgi:type IV secretory pathway VirB2 component (pilin)
MARRSLSSTRSSVLATLTRTLITALAAPVLFPALACAQSPWEQAAANLETSFTGPLARSLALVAIVIGGLMFMFGGGGAKRQIAGIVFGGGLALFAAQFLTWLHLCGRTKSIRQGASHVLCLRSPSRPGDGW